MQVQQLPPRCPTEQGLFQAAGNCWAVLEKPGELGLQRTPEDQVNITTRLRQLMDWVGILT